jgi:DNA end-binding protein Ku
MAPRALWTGSVRFGLVNVPVRIYTAVHEHKLQFHLLHDKDDGPIGYEKVCKLEDKPVANDEIVKAYEYKKGEFVRLSDEDFESVQVEGGLHALEIEDFVAYDEIDPTFFAHTYLVGPQEGAEKTYALLVRAMEESGLAGIGSFVMRNRDYLGCLRVRDGVLTLEQMHFADEVDPPEKVVPQRRPSVPRRELEMALNLIEAFSGKWQPMKYKDRYTDALMEVVEAKVKGREIHRVAEPEEEQPPDLNEALRLSIEQQKRGGSGRRARPAGTRTAADAETATKRELEEQARKLGVEGRSKMTKQELAKAISSAGR